MFHEWSYQHRARITICSMPEFTSREKGLQYDVPYLKIQVEREDYNMSSLTEVTSREREDYNIMFLIWSYK